MFVFVTDNNYRRVLKILLHCQVKSELRLEDFVSEFFAIFPYLKGKIKCFPKNRKKFLM